jgi:hypothetical protein
VLGIYAEPAVTADKRFWRNESIDIQDLSISEHSPTSRGDDVTELFGAGAVLDSDANGILFNADHSDERRNKGQQGPGIIGI